MIPTDSLSNRKPYNHLPGYKASRKNPLTGIHVVIYDAEKQGMDPADGPWITTCEAHNTLCNSTNLPRARDLMKDPTIFCEKCRELSEFSGVA